MHKATNPDATWHLPLLKTYGSPFPSYLQGCSNQPTPSPRKDPRPNLLRAFVASQAFEAFQAFVAFQAFAAFRAYRIAACWEMEMADFLEYCQETPWWGHCAGHCFTIKNKESWSKVRGWVCHVPVRYIIFRRGNIIWQGAWSFLKPLHGKHQEIYQSLLAEVL